jgi:hypothetical protein
LVQKRNPEILVAIGRKGFPYFGEQLSASSETQRTQRWSAFGTRELQRLLNVDALGRDASEFFPGDRVDQRFAGAPARFPLAGNVVRKIHGFPLVGFSEDSVIGGYSSEL